MAGTEYPPLIQINEPLGESALLALNWSKNNCAQSSPERPGCAWYHGSWQVLRLLGVFHSILSDDDFFLPALKRLIDGGVRRVLVSGAADYAMLARVTAVAGEHLKDMRVTVIDLCETPLKLNAWYGDKFGVQVEIIKDNVLNHSPAEPYDLICTHSFLCFFSPQDRQRLVHRWFAWLRPGGTVLTAQRVRTKDRQPIIKYTEDEVKALAGRTYMKAVQQQKSKGIEPGLARQLAEEYGRYHWTFLIDTTQEIRSLFESQGFRLDTFSRPPGELAVADVPGTPNQAGSVRWRILASRL